MDSTVFESILVIFRNQISLQQELFDQANRMRTFILAREMEQISTVSHTVDQITAEIERLEIERRQIAASTEKGDSANRSFESFLRILPPEQSEELTKIHKELKNAIKETSRVTIGNRILLEEALLSIRSSVNAIAGTAKPSTGYDHTGKSSNNKRKFLNQVG